MRWFLRIAKTIFERLWSLTRVGEYGAETPSAAELAAAEAAQQRMIAEVSANPADRLLAQALLRADELPAGVREVWRSWSPTDPATPIAAAVSQSLAATGVIRRQPSVRLLLDLRRYVSEAEAAAATTRPPDRIMADGRRMRPRIGAAGDDLTIYEWSRHAGAEVVERVLELRLQRGAAVASLITQANHPPADWDQQVETLMRQVGARLR